MPVPLYFVLRNGLAYAISRRENVEQDRQGTTRIQVPDPFGIYHGEKYVWLAETKLGYHPFPTYPDECRIVRTEYQVLWIVADCRELPLLSYGTKTKLIRIYSFGDTLLANRSRGRVFDKWRFRHYNGLEESFPRFCDFESSDSSDSDESEPLLVKQGQRYLSLKIEQSLQERRDDFNQKDDQEKWAKVLQWNTQCNFLPLMIWGLIEAYCFQKRQSQMWLDHPSFRKMLRLESQPIYRIEAKKTATQQSSIDVGRLGKNFFVVSIVTFLIFKKLLQWKVYP